MNHQSSNLDLLRSVAVLSVVQCHIWKVFHLDQGTPFDDWGLVNLGHFGVLMFFIHTSLVLMFSLDRLTSDGRGTVAGRFYIRRLFRIYPLSILTVVLMLGLRIPSYFQPRFAPLGAKVTIANLLLMQNVWRWDSAVGPLWSLPYEVQMYLLLPFLYLAAKRLRSHGGAAALILGGLVAMAVEQRIARHFGYAPLLLYAPWFCMGIAAYVVSRFARPTISGRWFYPVLAVFVAAQCITHKFVKSYRSGWVLWADGFVFAMALPHFEDIAAPAIRKVCHTIATYSYGIYLWHVPILWFAFQRLAGQPVALRVITFAVLIVALPLALYHCVEAPLIRVGGSLAQSITTPKLAPAAAPVNQGPVG